MTHGTDTDPRWYATAFDALYPVVYAHRTVEAAREEALAAARHVGLTERDQVLDLACGGGRHMVHLADLAGSITGLDYSMDLLRLAYRLVGPGSGRSRAARLVRGDMRALPFAVGFDVVVNFFTSFGYFGTRGENLRVVTQVARCLKPGGRFFIDYVNARYVEATLQPRSERVSRGYHIEEERWINGERRVNKSTVVRRDDSVVRRYSESVQLYEPEEFRGLLGEGGLQVDHIYGDYAGGPLRDDRPRMIAVGHRP